MANKTQLILTCNVCLETMDRQDRVPVCLPSCGHSFCRICLITINRIERRIKCPTCQKLHEGPPPESLPINWTLAALIDSTESNRSHSTYSTTNEHPHNTREANSFTDKNNIVTEDKKPRNGQDNCGTDADNNSNNKRRDILKGVGIAAASLVGGFGLVAAAPVALAGVGFTSAGVAAGSWAAGMMSSAAVANGGGIAAGSLVAVLQSAGAAGIGTAATATLGGAGAGIGGGIAYGAQKLFGRASNSNDDNSNNSNDDPGNDDSNDRKKRQFDDDDKCILDSDTDDSHDEEGSDDKDDLFKV